MMIPPSAPGFSLFLQPHFLCLHLLSLPGGLLGWNVKLVFATLFLIFQGGNITCFSQTLHSQGESNITVSTGN